MLLRTITLMVVLVGLYSYANAAEITPYGSFNYKWSNDENSSGVSVNKLEDNGSKIGIDIDDIGVEGQTIIGFAKLEVGVDTDDSGSNTFDSRLAYVGLTRAKNLAYISFSMNRFYQGDWIDCMASRFIDELPEKNIEKNNFFEKNDDEYFDFNQDLEEENRIKSPGWIRYIKKIK